MSLKWSEGTMIKFIDLYHNHDCLWNHRLDSYKNKNARDNALCVIAREMGIDGPIITATDVRNKIKTIRTMYKKELTIVLRSKKSGTGTDDVYKPKLFWFKKVDEFLRGVSAQRNSSSNWVSYILLCLSDKYLVIHILHYILIVIYHILLPRHSPTI